MTIFEHFEQLRKRNKILFTVIMGAAVIMFWKGTWSLLDIVIDEWLFRQHLFWSNLAIMLAGLGILIASGLALDRLV